MPRKNIGAAMGSGERLDTMEGFNDLYDEEDLTCNNNFNWIATPNADLYDVELLTCNFSFTEIGTENEELHLSYENNGINNSSIGCNKNN